MEDLSFGLFFMQSPNRRVLIKARSTPINYTRASPILFLSKQGMPLCLLGAVFFIVPLPEFSRQ